MGSIPLSCRIDAGTRKTPPMRKAIRTSQNVQCQRLTTPTPSSIRKVESAVRKEETRLLEDHDDKPLRVGGGRHVAE